MIAETYEIADFVFNVKTNYSYFHNQAKAYLSTKQASFNIEITKEDMDYEAMLCTEFNPANQDGYVEYLAVLRKFCKEIAAKGAILFHGALIAADNEGYIYAAKSGTGKTTHVNLLKEVYGNRIKILNGDKPILRIIKDKVYAYGTPWSGKEKQNMNEKVELKAICLLNRGEKNSIEKISTLEAFPKLYAQTYKPEDGTNIKEIMASASQIFNTTELYNLYCNMEKEAAKVSFEGMNQKMNFEEVLDKYGKLVYTNCGTSMLPFIHERKDVLTIERLNRMPKKYDVVLFKRESGEYVLHRIIKIKDDYYVVSGDNTTYKEKVKYESILGTLTAITRDGKTMELYDNAKFKFHSFFVTNFYHVRVLILKIKGKLSNGKHK